MNDVSKREILHRLGNVALAFFGVIVASTVPIPWDDAQFWAGVGMVTIGAYRNTAGSYLGMGKTK